jgi:hypothetical protein
MVDPGIQAVLKKIFKYLPLTYDNLEYKKKEGIVIKLKPLIRDLVTKAIERQMGHDVGDARDGHDEEELSSGQVRLERREGKK